MDRRTALKSLEFLQGFLLDFFGLTRTYSERLPREQWERIDDIVMQMMKEGMDCLDSEQFTLAEMREQLAKVAPRFSEHKGEWNQDWEIALEMWNKALALWDLNQRGTGHA